MNLNFLKELYFLYPLYILVEKNKIIKNIHKEKIIIYQMGKVGSSTVYETVKNMNLDFSVNHIHFLSDDGILEAENFFRNSVSKKIPMHLHRSKLIKEYFNFKNEKIKFITLTREPIGRIISDVFQNLKYFYPDLIDGQQLKTEEIQQIVSSKLDISNVDSEFATNWFDNELIKALDIDIFEYAFDVEKGYSIIKNANIEILLLQMEGMNNILEEALQEFFNYKNSIKIQHTNIGDNKVFSNEQSWIKNNIQLNDEVLSAFYSTKYMKHFYSDQQIRKFKNKWKL